MQKITYAELARQFREHEKDRPLTHLTANIVFSEDSFEQPYPLSARTYSISSLNKAYLPNMGGYSIYGTSIDGTDPLVRLERYMAAEKGGRDGWKVDYCYMTTDSILNKLTRVCPFPEVFEDTEPEDNGIMDYPRRKIMHFRADHDGYRWHNTVWPCHDDLAKPEMKREIDETYEALIAEDALADLSVLRVFCRAHTETRANENAADEYNFYLRGELCDYWLRLITRERDYNMYLSAYAREPEEKPNPYQKYFDYLNRLRESGETNMWGAVPYLQREFPELGFDKARAREIHSAWMKSFQEGTDQ